MLEKMKALAQKRNFCVLATVSARQPHCSLMAYATDDDCRELYMVTHKSTQKYRNLTKNPAVSILIDTREENRSSDRLLQVKALTLTGVFQRISEDTKRNFVRSKLLKNHPYLQEFIDHPDAELFCIKINDFLLLDGLTEAYFETLSPA